jgi:hypothetical protein
MYAQQIDWHDSSRSKSMTPRRRRSGSQSYFERSNVTEAKSATPALKLSIDENLGRWFTNLATNWKAETRACSSINQKTEHPAFLRIIALGPDAIPLILAELQRETDHWFPALKRISNADPVPPHFRGNVEEMRNAWLRWGRKRKLLK